VIGRNKKYLKNVFGKLWRNRALGALKPTWDDNIKMDVGDRI